MDGTTIHFNQHPVSSPVAPGDLLFAPLEGITHAYFRNLIYEHYPEWDVLCCDFLRAPSNGNYPKKFLIQHIGTETLQNSARLNKTMVQILTSPSGRVEPLLDDLQSLGVKWIDLNLGCPSNTVLKHQGGSFWLGELKRLQILINVLRKKIQCFFSVKTRLGLQDTAMFLPILKMLESEGVDLITVHARTAAQNYKGVADWSYIQQAVKTLKTPIIGNGDVYQNNDYQNILQQTNCYGVMMGRGALQRPWAAREIKLSLENNKSLTDATAKKNIHEFLINFVQYAKVAEINHSSICKKIKELSRYLLLPFADDPQNSMLKRAMLLANSWEAQLDLMATWSLELPKNK